MANYFERTLIAGVVKNPPPIAMLKGVWFECEDSLYITRFLFYRGVYYIVDFRRVGDGEETLLG